MEFLTIICSCPPDEGEVGFFCKKFMLFSRDCRDTFDASLVLVDEQGFSRKYSDAFFEDISCGAIRLVFSSRLGQFDALYEEAAKVEKGVVVTMDPDMSGNIDDVGRLYAAIRDGHDLVFAMRTKRGDVSIVRAVISKFFNHVIRWFMGRGVQDINTPMVMFRAELSVGFRDFPADAGHPKLYFPYLLGDRFCEVPIEVAFNRKRSSYTWKHLLRLAWGQVVQAYRFSRYVRARDGSSDSQGV